MSWEVEFYEDFDKEFDDFNEAVQNEVFAKIKLLEEYGPQLARPHADTLHGSNYTNMKELRISVISEVWRVAFAFDTRRKAIFLVGADKQGVNQKIFYKRLISLADARFDDHLKNLNKYK